MSKETETDESTKSKKDVEEEEIESKEESEEESEEDESGDSDEDIDDSDEHSENKDEEEGDEDLDEELNRERNFPKKGDKKKANDAFHDRAKKREQKDDDRFLSRKEFLEMMENDRKQRLEEEAVREAKSISGGNQKLAELIIAKWKNRSFPEGLPLSEQIEEMYVVVNRKKLIGTNKELARALAGRDGKQKGQSGSSHRQGMEGPEIKIPEEDKKVYEQSGFKYNPSTKLFEKTLPKGQILVKDPKSKATYIKQ